MNIPLNIDWQQIFLHLFNFAILAMGLYVLLYKPVNAFMEKRAAYYRDMEAAAKTRLTEAEKDKAQYDALLQKAQGEIDHMQRESQEEIKKTREEQLKQAKAQADKIVANARKEAEREHDRMIGDAQKEVAEMVTTATEKILLPSTTSEVFDRFLTSAERSVQSE